jgi:aspartate carbamoyltransferase
VQLISGDYRGKDIVAVKQFDKNDLAILFKEADRLRTAIEQGQVITSLKGKIMANLFYEPSTRTSSSFAAAIQRLGGGLIPINDVQYSSVTKGENLEDTVRTLEQYSDLIVLRHHQKGQADVAAAVTRKPIINAGDGAGEHPTQALLDLYTILRECGQIEGLTITMVGDLKYGRTVHSLVHFLSMYGVKVIFVSPDSLRMPRVYIDELKAQGIAQTETGNLESVMAQTDVLYMTRIQKERFESEAAYQAVKGVYVLTPEIMKLGKKSLKIMHPLPRVDEIAPEVDQDPRAAYFREVENGMYVRMALLNLVLAK